VADVGTLQWAQRTGGRIGLRDKLAQLAAAVAMQVRILPAQLRWRLGLAEPGALIDITEIPIPDSALARRAEEHCREVSPPYLVNHCLRTYLWAQALSVPCGLRPDNEMLWVASLLHDLGLTQRYSEGDSAIYCFAVRGGQAARALAQKDGWSPSRAAMLAEAIVLHLNVTVDVEHGVEALLLNAATALDVTGLRIWELHRDTVRAVIDRHPRTAMKRDILHAWNREAESHPGSRAHFLSHWLQFESRIRAAPFAE
jgi:hypothetical protein